MREVVSSPGGSVWSEEETGTFDITDIREERGCLCRRQEGQSWDKRGKGQSSRDSSKTEWPFCQILQDGSVT